MKTIEDVYSFEDLAVALADCAYNHLYRLEPRIGKPPLRNVNNQNSSVLQGGTHILMHLRILSPIDGHGIRSVFICEPSEFRSRIEQNNSGNCSYDQLVGALSWFLDYTGDDALYDMFSSFGFCTRIYPNLELCPHNRKIVWSEMINKYHGLSYPSFWDDANKMFEGGTLGT